jgi:predicted secreted protein
MAVVTYRVKTASMKQYLVDKNGKVDLVLPKDSSFIVSLPANRTIAYNWNIKSDVDHGIIKFEKRSWIEIPIPKPERGKNGANYDRQNFYIKPLKSGDEKIAFRYEHETMQNQEFFEINLNVKVQ